MEQVAQMLGVELEEEFNIYKDKDKAVYKFTEHGLLAYSKENQNWMRTYGLLEKLLIGYTKIIKKPILDEVEKEYLKAVIKPFRDKVSYICKKKSDCTKMEWIQIGIETDMNLDFPSFEIGAMYKGMELNREYTLEDLGL